MDLLGLVGAIKDWTPTTLMAVAVFILSHFLNLFKEQKEKDEEQNKEFKENLSNGLNRIESKLTKEISDIQAEQKKHAKEIEALKVEKLEREDFYKDMGGWRAEINRLQDLIIKQNTEVFNKLIDIWQKK